MNEPMNKLMNNSINLTGYPPKVNVYINITPVVISTAPVIIYDSMKYVPVVKRIFGILQCIVKGKLLLLTYVDLSMQRQNKEKSREGVERYFMKTISLHRSFCILERVRHTINYKAATPLMDINKNLIWGCRLLWC